ncbi:DUF4192 domain-containing protein [Catenuloplanes japonicus]|uniref:DUF4192 domain-containing protein n=1 Tax=Catenuloplanes japonicus TaxID=33876 RepID=UPI00068DD8D2|nr:DUF4192 domain-containing protein [Catenuloplanes japonicus]
MSLSDLRVTSPAHLIAVVPYLLGFHPRDSLVVVGRHDNALVFAARQDLPPPDLSFPEIDEYARQIATVVARQTVDSVVLIGYTGAHLSGAALVAAVNDALLDLRIPVREQLRVADGRFWCYLCTDENCCPSAGRAYTDAADEIRAAAGFEVHTDRAAMVASLAPVTGAARDAMLAATVEADRRLDVLCAGLDPGPGVLLGALRRIGSRAVGDAMSRHHDGGTLDDDEMAWLTVLLTQDPVSEYALNHAQGAGWEVALWSDVVRRARPELAAVPAVLLAFTAWRLGQGALASVAVDRALSLDPHLVIARLLDDVLADGIPPSALDAPRAA